MGYEGFYRTAKDYLQPVLVAAAAGMSLLADIEEGPQRTALLAAAVGLPLYLLSSVASRGSHRLTARLGGEMPAARWLWGILLLISAAMAAEALLGTSWAMIAMFIALAITQNLWMPISVARVADGAARDQTATVLSIKSQGKRLFTAVAAPLVGWGVDAITEAAHSSSTIQPSWQLLPVAGLGIALAALALATGRQWNYDPLKR